MAKKNKLDKDETKKMTVLVSVDNYKHVKKLSIDQDCTMSDIVEGILNEYWTLKGET